MRLVTLSGREGTDKPVCGVRESYRGGQPKLLWSGLAWLRTAVTKVENKTLTAKLLFFFDRPTGFNFMGYLYVSCSGDYSNTHANNNNSVVLLTPVRSMGIVNL